MSPDYIAEREAHLKFARLLNEIEECKRVFENAGLALPEMLRRLMRAGDGKAATPKVHIQPPLRMSRPSEATESWLSIKAKYASATSLVLATLREEKGPVKLSVVVDRITSIDPKIPRGSIHNIGTRLGHSLIKRTPEGWSLTDRNKAGVFHEGYLWGPKSVFEKTELAAHRREAILHILRCFTGGLQTVQLVEQLRGCGWMQAPASKDLVKADMEWLEGHGLVRRISNSRKWEVVAGVED